MDQQTLRILNTLSSHIGQPMSINQLTEQVKNKYGSAYYANIYEKLQDLKEEGLLTLETLGKSSSVKLNFENYLLTENLAEVEIEKKIQLLSSRQSSIAFLEEMESTLTEKTPIKTISMVDPLRNLKLNRIELFFLLKETLDLHNQTMTIYADTLRMQNKYNLKVNSLTISENYFEHMLTSEETNPVKDALTQQTTIYNPQTFWKKMKEIAKKGQIRLGISETKPSSISDLDLTFNLNRFGYNELGASFSQGKKICIEYIVTALLLKEEARSTETAAVILAKNGFNINMLAFLGQKFQTTPRLLGIFRVLQQTRSKIEYQNAIEIISSINPEHYFVDKIGISQKLELYNAL